MKKVIGRTSVQIVSQIMFERRKDCRVYAWCNCCERDYEQSFAPEEEVKLVGWLTGKYNYGSGECIVHKCTQCLDHIGFPGDTYEWTK